jgi:ABC-2 type transport system ATP-binding protein
MLCHKVVIIHQGRIVAEDAPQNLRERLSAARVQTIRAQIQGPGPASAIEQQLRALPGVAEVHLQGQEQGFTCFDCTTGGQDIRAAIFDLAVQQRWRLRELASRGATLEEVFLALTQQTEQP